MCGIFFSPSLQCNKAIRYYWNTFLPFISCISFDHLQQLRQLRCKCRVHLIDCRSAGWITLQTFCYLYVVSERLQTQSLHSDTMPPKTLLCVIPTLVVTEWTEPHYTPPILPLLHSLLQLSHQDHMDVMLWPTLSLSLSLCHIRTHTRQCNNNFSDQPALRFWTVLDL